MPTVTVRNDFHGREAQARADADGWLTRRQVERLRRALCAPGCTCSGETGARGPGNPGEVDSRQVFPSDADQRCVRLDVADLADLSSPAAQLGARGGRAGRGAAKARTSEQARAAANARWGKR